ncbi:hypothetical protein [Hymenobacter arcticus]
MAGLLGCSSPATQQAAQPAKPVAASPAQPATAPELAVKDYLQWYAAHHDEFNADFITGGGLDSTTFYAVDMSAADDWLARLSQSKHFSAAYVQGWRDYIGSYADTLRRRPQNDGPPEGFSYDLLMLSQEADTRLEELQKGTMLTSYAATKDSATVQARGQQHEGWREGLDFTLSQNPAGKWLIDSIEVPTNLAQ